MSKSNRNKLSLGKKRIPLPEPSQITSCFYKRPQTIERQDGVDENEQPSVDMIKISTELETSEPSLSQSISYSDSEIDVAVGLKRDVNLSSDQSLDLDSSSDDDVVILSMVNPNTNKPSNGKRSHLEVLEERRRMINVQIKCLEKERNEIDVDINRALLMISQEVSHDLSFQSKKIKTESSPIDTKCLDKLQTCQENASLIINIEDCDSPPPRSPTPFEVELEQGRGLWRIGTQGFSLVDAEGCAVHTSQYQDLSPQHFRSLDMPRTPLEQSVKPNDTSYNTSKSTVRESSLSNNEEVRNASRCENDDFLKHCNDDSDGSDSEVDLCGGALTQLIEAMDSEGS
mmetsp:Transcript_46807/g.60158  ORF Transcript_46807/g.60158 Transcript_46807/m.60158 type:complete len:343 (-) Transcript_46807:70-1098(-)|eukprot:CAMPEP_0114360792 /NCGR_PEP_ID=MMETSP0101-20121206/24131_1 /TAXON_ID=38822 ORGANISM="Pteridomonas danica, Strain PT" /NCGR_SAMPLE_ID=MMETSP0101 /ASSEMBLY_ACC=CAM_ASM_000211 /LENGTH=342 /DNA_ID=CAMNT_0001505209 /DNA_START=82 /DNA_END=1110 /DNA_ORIENTATION=+